MRRNFTFWRNYLANLGSNIALYLGAFMCCTIVLIIPGIIFLLYWAVTQNNGEDKTQYVEHHHHYEENKIINVDARDGRHSFKHTEKHENFQGYLDLK
jgi:hypothetical protein